MPATLLLATLLARPPAVDATDDAIATDAPGVEVRNVAGEEVVTLDAKKWMDPVHGPQSQRRTVGEVRDAVKSFATNPYHTITLLKQAGDTPLDDADEAPEVVTMATARLTYEEAEPLIHRAFATFPSVDSDPLFWAPQGPAWQVARDWRQGTPLEDPARGLREAADRDAAAIVEAIDEWPTTADAIKLRTLVQRALFAGFPETTRALCRHDGIGDELRSCELLCMDTYRWLEEPGAILSGAACAVLQAPWFSVHPQLTTYFLRSIADRLMARLLDFKYYGPFTPAQRVEFLALIDAVAEAAATLDNVESGDKARALSELWELRQSAEAMKIA